VKAHFDFVHGQGGPYLPVHRIHHALLLLPFGYVWLVGHHYDFVATVGKGCHRVTHTGKEMESPK
jgi:hypothetical protein